MKSPERLALAFDVGTTTIAATLLERSSGKQLVTAGSLNPQREFGADVVARLDVAVKSAADLKRLACLVNGELERLAGELLTAAGASTQDVGIIGIAGNPAMEHLILGLPVRSLAFPPYRPLFTAGRAARTADLGWRFDVETYLFPLPGGFVGGDLVAFLYGEGGTAPRTPRPPCLYLDLGTNGEMALVTGTTILATSAAAGPAFEGGNLTCGMAALPGAISGVTFSRDAVKIATIGGAPPVGLCGSGVIEAVTALLAAGVMDGSGRLRSRDEVSSNLANRLIELGGEPAFLLYRDARVELCLTQQDIRQFQLAKGAIRAGLEVLCERARIDSSAVAEAVLTGSFGAVLDPEGLKNVGILPEKMVKISGFVRNGALAGVERALGTPGGFEAVERLAEKVRVIPLSGTPAFEKHFLEQMNFPQSKS